MNYVNTDNFFGFSGTDLIGSVIINQLLIKQKNYDDLIIIQKYTSQMNTTGLLMLMHT